MGHCFISGTIECTKEKLNSVIDQKRQQAGFESGWSYSGRINMLVDQMEYTPTMLARDLRIWFTEAEIKQDSKFLDADDKKRMKRMLRLKEKHNIAQELTVADLVKRCNGKKIQEWKRFILDWFWHAESDILYIVQTTQKSFFYFGYPRC